MFPLDIQLQSLRIFERTITNSNLLRGSPLKKSLSELLFFLNLILKLVFRQSLVLVMSHFGGRKDVSQNITFFRILTTFYQFYHFYPNLTIQKPFFIAVCVFFTNKLTKLRSIYFSFCTQPNLKKDHSYHIGENWLFCYNSPF